MQKNNIELSAIFSALASFMEMDGIPFKPQAYQRAAEALESLSEDVGVIYEQKGEKGLDEIPGVGKGIAAKIQEYLKTGKVQEYEKYQKRAPIDIEALTSVEGLGPRTAKELWKKLGAADLKGLEEAAKAGKIRGLPGFGKKTEENILQGIAFVKKSQKRQLLGKAYPYVQDLIALLKASGFVDRISPAGSFRRMRETVGDVDILVTTNEPEKLFDYFLEHVPHVKVWGRGSTKISVRTVPGFDIDIRAVPDEVYGAALQYFTGSKAHNVKLRTYAVSKKLSVSEYGVFKGKKKIAGATEEEVYRTLGLTYMDPEMREDTGELELVFEGKPLPKLVPYGALKGDLQIQTDWTDGKESMEAMAEEAKRLGLEYIAITDHTRDLAMTRGLDEKRLAQQMEEIDRLNKKLSGITVLKGAEVNIRKDGTLDIADETLAKLDVVGISVHSHFRMTQKEMTRRIIRAMENRHADILFHPTGRLINRREAYEVDMEEVIKAAKETGTLLEINAFPDRLDLKDAFIRKAVEAGVTLVIDSDAHHSEHLSYLHFGIAQARRGWAEAKDIANTKPLKEFLATLKK